MKKVKLILILVIISFLSNTFAADIIKDFAGYKVWENNTRNNFDIGKAGKGFVDDANGTLNLVVSVLKEAAIYKLSEMTGTTSAYSQWKGQQIKDMAIAVVDNVNQNGGLANTLDQAAYNTMAYVRDNPEAVVGAFGFEALITGVTLGVGKLATIAAKGAESLAPVVKVAEVGGDKLKKLALGRNRIDNMPTLKLFADKIGVKRVLDLHTPKNMNLLDEISLRLSEADEIHFNLDGLGDDFKNILEQGRRFTYDSGIPYTSWEFSQVIDDSTLLNKAFFHYPDGSIMSGSNFQF